MISIDSETLLTLQEVSQHLPARNGRRLHYSTIFRWAQRGVRGRRLETLLVGGTRFTSLEALSRFLAADSSTLETKVSDGVLEAERQLKRDGIV